MVSAPSPQSSGSSRPQRGISSPSTPAWVWASCASSWACSDRSGARSRGATCRVRRRHRPGSRNIRRPLWPAKLPAPPPNRGGTLRNPDGRYAMNPTDSITGSQTSSRPRRVGSDGAALAPSKPLVSVVVPAYNEAAIVEKNLAALCRYMESLEDEYRWEVVFVNDGSSDGTGRLAEAFARTRSNIHVLHHPQNFWLGHT